MKTFTDYFSELKPHITGYIDIAFEIKADICRASEVIGVFCNSHSIIAKDFAMGRVFHAIKKLQIPLIILDSNEYSTHFKILINE